MAAVEAIAAAIGQISNMVGSFVGAASQKRAYTQGMAVEGISIERQKSLASYQGIAANRQTMMFLILGLTAMVILILIFKKNTAQ